MRPDPTGVLVLQFILRFLLLLCCLWWPGPADAALPAAPPILRSLKITGAQIIPAAKVKEELTFPLPSRWPWKKPPAFRAGDLDADVEILKNFYRRQGFYHAQIDAEVHRRDTGQVDVVLHITEGPWVKVTAVELTGTEAISETDLAQLRQQSPLKPGSRFSEENYDILKRQYLNFLLDHGYPQARVQGEICLNPEDNTAAISLTLTPGPFCYFGEVHLKGELETPDYVILRKLTFKKGQVFSFQEIYQSQRLLYAMDLFQTVFIAPAEIQPGDHYVPIIIEIRERLKRHSVKMGLGYGSEDLVRARLGLRWRNFGGGGRMLDLDSKYSVREKRVSGAFTNPQIFGSYFDLVFQGGWIRQDLPGFTDKAYYTQARLERDLPWHLKLQIGHSLEFARPFNIPLSTLILLQETQPGKLYRASMAFAGLRHDTTDNDVDPSRGGILSAVGEVAPDFLGSNLQFVRTTLEARRYQGLGQKNFVLAGRLRVGLMEPIQATTDIPIYRRFFSGGYNSVRGYRLDYLGPRDISGSPIGGNALLEGSLEARLPLYKDFRAVAFLDFGNVYLNIKNIDLGQVKYCSGLGLRYATPIGPIGVDVGLPLNPIDPHKDKYQFYFSIGQSF